MDTTETAGFNLDRVLGSPKACHGTISERIRSERSLGRSVLYRGLLYRGLLYRELYRGLLYRRLSMFSRGDSHYPR